MNPHPHEAWRDRLEQQFPAVQSSMPKRQLLADFEAVELFIRALLEQDRMEQRELFAAKLKSATEDFDGVYSKFPAREAAIIIENRINGILQDNEQ